MRFFSPRPLSGLRRWLRHTWISRLAIVDWLHDWPGFLFADRREPAKRSAYRPEFEQMDSRWTADDFLGAARLPLFGGGLAIFGSVLINPATLLGNTSLVADPAVSPPNGGDQLLGKPEP